MMDKVFLKNFYYNRNSIVKLIFLYNHLSDNLFLNELSKRIEKCNFSILEKKTDVLLSIYKELLPKYIKEEHDFGYVWIYDDHICFYFKTDFEFSAFLNYFLKLKDSHDVDGSILNFSIKKLRF